jgi:hypothetical protein
LSMGLFAKRYIFTLQKKTMNHGCDQRY